MRGERLHEAEAVFHAVVDLAPGDRARELTQRCGDDEALRAFVEKLLASHDADAVPLLRTPVYGRTNASSPAATADLPARIGAYSIVRVIGEGGMGVVYLAEQSEPLRRRVALKVLRHGMHHRQHVARFEAERQVLALMNHPHIAKILDAGVTADGSPYFAMEYVAGIPITDYCEARRLGVRERLTLVQLLCDAIQHAHQKGVIHRDLKPGNILIDDSGMPKILDFGVARLTDADTQAVTLRTAAGQLIGTVPYMSPEQVAGVSANIDTRADVYALGVICFRLLTGFLPYDVEGRSIPEVVRIIAEQEPSRLGSVDTLYRGDLETIVSKALAKDKTQRYASASEFAADIRRYLEQRPISARPPTTLYQLRMFARRNKTLVGGVAATFLAMIVGISATSIQTVRMTRERNVAQRAEQVAAQRAYGANIAAALAALRANDVLTARQHLDAADPDLRNWEWRYLAAQLDTSVVTLAGHEHHVWSVAFLNAGNQLATSSADGTVKLWDLATGRATQTIPIARSTVRRVAVSPDERLLATAAEDGSVQLWCRETGARVLQLAGHNAPVMDVAFSPNGTLLASASYDKTVRVWNASSGALLQTLRHPHWVNRLCFSSDSSRLATSCRDNIARVWNLASASVVCAVEIAPATRANDHVHCWAVTLDPAGTILATGGHDGLIRLWDTSTGALEHMLVGHTGRVRALAYSPDGTHLASASDDRTVRIWAPADELQIATFLGHTDSVFDVAFSPDGARLASASRDHSVRLWNAQVTRDADRISAPGSFGIPAIAVTPDSSRLVGAGEDGTVRVWDVASGAELAALAGYHRSVYAVAISSDAAMVATGARDGAVMVWDLDNRRALATFTGHKGPVRSVAFLNGDDRLASAAEDGTIHVWAMGHPEPVRILRSDTKCFTAMALDPGGEQLVSGSDDGRLEFWDTATVQRCRVVDAHSRRIRCLVFSPDGRTLISTSDDRTLKLWEPKTGNLRETWNGHTDAVSAAAFSSDGRRVASVSFDRTLRLWNTQSGDMLFSCQAHQDWPWAVVFSPDGRWLASSGRTTRIWWAPPPLASHHPSH